MRKPNSVPLVAVGVLAVASLVIMNVISLKNAPKTEAQLQQEEQEKAKSEPTPAVQATPAASASEGDLVLKDGSAELGPETATKKIVVGYQWTPAIQGNPGSIKNIVEMLTKAAPDAHVSLVNVDDRPDVPVGIQVDGKVVAPIGDDGVVPPNQISAVMQSISAKK